jgi:kynureninase
MKHTFDPIFSQMIEYQAKNQLIDTRSLFFLPEGFIYFCGNSLGMQPKATKHRIIQELDDWATLGVEGHLEAKNPWLYYHHLFKNSLARLTGGLPQEVVAMNALTVNIHLLLGTFYRPNREKFKIIIESQSFSSDYYAIVSQIEFHGLNSKDVLIEIKPRENEYLLSTEDILTTIELNAKHLALVWLGGVNYYSGQVLDMKEISAKAHEVGSIVGFDLAHAIGNIPLKLHDWSVDFATWCSYKYLNSGPGGVSGIFVHKNVLAKFPPAFKGWWGNDEENRFKMEKIFTPSHGVDAWQLSNAPILSMAAHKAALEIFDKIDLDLLFEKTSQMNHCLLNGIEIIQNKYQDCDLKVITPETSQNRGSQTSLVAQKYGKELFVFLKNNKIIADWREPDVIRIALVPLYNTFEEILTFLHILDQFYDSKAHA